MKDERSDDHRQGDEKQKYIFKKCKWISINESGEKERKWKRKEVRKKGRSTSKRKEDRKMKKKRKKK